MAAIAKEVFEALFLELDGFSDRKKELTIQAKEAREAFLLNHEGLDKKVLAKLYRDYKELLANEERYVSEEYEKDTYVNMFLTPATTATTEETTEVE